MMTTLKVKGMTCGGCAAAIKRAIARVDPAAAVDVDLKGGQVHVQSARDAATLRSAIETAGYQVVS